MGGSNINTDRQKAFQRTNIRELSKDVDHVIPIKIVKNIAPSRGLSTWPQARPQVPVDGCANL